MSSSSRLKSLWSRRQGTPEGGPESAQSSDGPTARPDPSTADLLAEVVAHAGEPIGLQGHLDQIGVESLIESFRRRRQSGRLYVRTTDELLDFELREGRIVRVQIDGPADPSERLGATLVDLGFVEQEVLDAHLGDGEDADEPLGAALVEAGVISREQLTEAVEVQTVTRLVRAMEADGGAYAFSACSGDSTIPLTGVDVDPFSLLESVLGRDTEDADTDDEDPA